MDVQKSCFGGMMFAVGLSLTSGQFHPTLKESVIPPLLKKPTVDKEELSNYRPISNLSLISKIIERVVNIVDCGNKYGRKFFVKPGGDGI